MEALRIGIVAHNSRATEAHTLMKTVGAAVLSMDNGSRGCSGNHIHVWETLSTMPTQWSVVLEDDAVPVDGFRDQLEQALAAAEAPIASLYLGTGHPTTKQPRIAKAITTAQQNDTCWITTPRVLHAVALAIHTELIPDMLTHIKTSHWEIDRAISHWAETRHHPVAYTAPSLVDHHDGPTTTTHRRRTVHQPRHAWWTGTRTHWNTTSTPL